MKKKKKKKFGKARLSWSKSIVNFFFLPYGVAQAQSFAGLTLGPTLHMTDVGATPKGCGCNI